MYSTITSKGQITLPKEVRENLSLQRGDRIEFLMEEDGKYSIIPLTSSLSALKSVLPKPDKPVSLKEIEESIKNRPMT